MARRWGLWMTGAVALATLFAAPTVRAEQPWVWPMPPLAALKAEVQRRAESQAYPVTGLRPDDVREVLAHLRSTDPDDWAAAWSAMGDRYMAAGAAALPGDRPAARRDFLQAWYNYMFAAWPAQYSSGKRLAYRKSTHAFRAYGKLLDPPMEVVEIPFEGRKIVGYLRLPEGSRPAPVVISIGGLDEYKENAMHVYGASFVAHGLGDFALDMPGTGESAVPMEPGAEREYVKAIDYLASRPDIDPKRIAVEGGSGGGYWAALLGYAQHARLKAAVVWGGPVDGYFQKGWQLGSWRHSSYLFGLQQARMAVYGYRDPDAFLAALPRFSLKARGILDQASTRMLLVDGARDTQVPISDLFMLLSTGSPKEAWVNPAGEHMARSPGWTSLTILDRVVTPWLVRQLEVH